MNGKETAKEFIKRIKSLPNPDLTDPTESARFNARIEEKLHPVFEEMDQESARNLGRAFKRAIY